MNLATKHFLIFENGASSLDSAMQWLVLFLCWNHVIHEVSWDLWICIISKLQNTLNAKWFDSRRLHHYFLL
jgi:hypothetical protein